ncbi:MAG: DUF5667 domain-containing protein [Candidatus Dojkabacteria bacterium]|jgi:hypothetical protein|nr:DUF5667 domain-containing protein [Candidatus Dojkabacteria bacterium]
MEERDLERQFKNINPKPSQEWQEKTLNHLNSVVTDSLDNRNSNTNLNNFFNSITMNTKFKAIVTVATVFTTFAIASGVVYASDSAMPGEMLFPVDKAVEQIRRTLTINPLDRAGYEMDIMDERVLELKKMSEGENSEQIANCISEVEAQQERVRAMLGEMTQLRAGDMNQAQEQLEVMNKLAAKIQNNQEVLGEVQNRLELKSGEATQAGELQRVRDSYSEEMGSEIKNFEESTGLKVEAQEAEQNKGEETQNKNQAEIKAGDENGEGEPAQDVQGVQEMNKGENGNR